jgi:hypothetical protein
MRLDRRRKTRKGNIRGRKLRGIWTKQHESWERGNKELARAGLVSFAETELQLSSPQPVTLLMTLSWFIVLQCALNLIN